MYTTKVKKKGDKFVRKESRDTWDSLVEGREWGIDKNYIIISKIT